MADVKYFADLVPPSSADITDNKIMAMQNDPKGSFGWKPTLEQLQDFFATSTAMPTTYLATETINEPEINVPVSGNGGAVILTSNPQIAVERDGKIKRLIGTNDTNTLTVVDGNGLALEGGLPFTLGLNDIIEFVFYNSLWIEKSRKDN